MKKIAVLLSAVILGGSTLAIAVPAQATTFGTGECTINLGPSYATNDGQALITFPPASVVSCATFTFDPTAGDSIYARFSTASGRSGATLSVTTKTVVDPTTNSTVSTNVLQLDANAANEPYTQLEPSNLGSYDPVHVVTHGGQEYLLKMGTPFTVVEGYTGDTCTLTMPKLSYTWGQASYISLPDSAMKCTGFTWNSADYQYAQQFKTATGTTITVSTTQRKAYDPVTKTMKITTGLEAHLPLGSDEFGNWFALRSKDTRSKEPRSRTTGNGPANTTFGKYSAWPSESTTYKILQAIPNVSYPVTLAKPFRFKAATTITATPTSIAGKPNMLSIHIQADRNQSFQNGNIPTYQRQSVIPSLKADHPTILRGGKEIKTVTLNKFGEATVTVKNPKGKQKFIVQMPMTASNWAGEDTFKK